MDVELEMELKLDAGEPRRVAERFEELGTEHGLPAKTVFRFQLALDEILTNVISYAFEGISLEPVITVNIHLKDTMLEVVVEDNGRPFDPLEDADVPDVDLPADGRPIGGLGVHLVKTFVHSLRYERVGGCNRLQLVQPLGAHLEDDS